MSSAYSSQLMRDPLSILIPVFIFARTLASLSGIRLKRIGDVQAPCLTPISI